MQLWRLRHARCGRNVSSAGKTVVINMVSGDLVDIRATSLILQMMIRVLVQGEQRRRKARHMMQAPDVDSQATPRAEYR